MNNKWIYSSLGIILLGLMLLLPSISALTTSTFTKEEVKSLDRITSFGTYKIEASAWYDPLQIWTKETIKEIELKTNTEKCIDCLSEGTIVLNKDGTLIDDLIWRRSFDEGKTFVDWKGFTNWRVLVEEDVDVFETQCINRKEIFDEKNGTSYFEQECSQVKTGTTKKWNNLDYKKEYKAGTYNYKIEGSKKAEVIYDWVIKTNGQLLENWAVWGNISTGSQAEVVLNSPANNSIQYTTLVTTNASANVTNGAYLVNAKLYDNSTGTWGARNTSLYDGTFQISEVSYSQSALTPITVYSGVKVIPSKDIWVWEVNKTSLTTATRALILDSSLNVLTSTTTLSGNKFIFSSAFKLNASSTYYVVLDANGASYVSTWTQAIGLPITSNKIQYTKGLQGTTDYNNRLFSINYINYTNSNLPPSQALTVKFTNSYPAGSNIKWNYQFCDSDGDCGFAPQNFTFTVDGTAPTITLNYPTSLINYGALNQTLQLNFTATDTNLDKVWYNYNGTNVTIAGATSGVANLSNITLSSKKNVTIYANDTAGNLNTTTFSWDYKVFENGQNYSATSTETGVESFISNFTLQTGATIDAAYLNYNGTLYAAVISQDNGNYILTSNANIPANINSSLSQNNSFFWQFNYIGDTTFNLNTTTLQQLVLPINLAVCGGSYTITALNFSLRNETIPLPYESNWSFGATFNYWAGNGLTSKNYTIQNTTVTNNILLCLANNTPVRINADINYFKSGFKERSYYFVNASVTNETNNITLWVAPSTDTSNIILHVTDEYLRPIKSGYVKAMRYYPGYNSYYNVVTGRTDDFGNANLDLIERTADYKFLILDSSGNLIYTTNPMKVICTTTPCTLEVVAGSIGGVLQDVETLNAISGYYTWNNATNYLTFTYNDATGLTSTMRLEVINVKPYGEVSICNTTVTGSSGIIPCLINQTTVSGEILARTYRAASPEKPFKIYSFSLSNAWQNFGADGLLWVMLFTITMFIAGVIINPMTAGILTLVSVVFMMVTGFVYMPLTLAVSIIVVIIIYIAKMRG